MDNTPAEEAALCPLLLTFQTAALFPGGESYPVDLTLYKNAVDVLYLWAYNLDTGGYPTQRLHSPSAGWNTASVYSYPGL